MTSIPQAINFGEAIASMEYVAATYGSEADPFGWATLIALAEAAGGTEGLLAAANNLSDLTDVTAARVALALVKGTAAGNIPVLDGAGKLETSVLPALALTEVQEAASQAAMLALTAQPGDVAIRTDINKSFILAATPSTTLANWKELRTPTDVVLSVAGQTGAITTAALVAAITTGNGVQVRTAVGLRPATLTGITLGGTDEAPTLAASGAETHPGYVAGRTYLPPRWASNSNGTPTASRIHASPFVIKSPVTISALVYNNNGNSASAGRLGIYDNLNGLPNQKLAETSNAADVSSGNDIIKTLSGGNITLTPGVYWLAYLNTSSHSVITYGSGEQSFLEFLGYATAGTLGLVAPAVGYQSTGTHSTLPTTFPAAALIDTAPIIGIRTA